MPIYRHTRLERRGDILERLLDAELGPWLDQNGFAERHPFSFRRRWESGDDAVFVNIEPRWFSVNVATAPDGMAEIYDLYDADGSFRGYIERGIVCASVLTPAGVFGTDRSDCTFKTRRAAIRAIKSPSPGPVPWPPVENVSRQARTRLKRSIALSWIMGTMSFLLLVSRSCNIVGYGSLGKRA